MGFNVVVTDRRSWWSKVIDRHLRGLAGDNAEEAADS